ncbi:MAG: S41 family peptidase [Chlamydiia bacterium]
MLWQVRANMLFGFHSLRMGLILGIGMLGCLGAANKLPTISPQDVPGKVREILHAHASHKTLSPTLAQRILDSFLQELDPYKLYFIELEIDDALHPDSALTQQVLDGFRSARFGPFEEIYQRMLEAIERRQAFELALDGQVLPKGLKAEDFKDLPWAQTPEELSERLRQLRGIQLDTASQWKSDEPVEQMLARIQKRRAMQEQQYASLKTPDGMAFFLSKLMKAVARSLDTHTAYFTPGEAQQFLIQVQQRLHGIGAQLRDDLDGLTIVKLIEGGPGDRGGRLKAKDKIIAVNGEPVVGMDMTDAVDLIRGPAHTEVSLTIMRSVMDDAGTRTEILAIPVTRDEVVLKDQRFDSQVIPFGQGVLAQLHLHAFYADPNTDSAADLAKVLQEISKEHCLEGVLLDLRRNGGGLLPQAVEVAGLFIDKGIVCSIKNSDGEVQHLRDFEGTCQYRGPLVILTDRSSASAAEIVAQTLQDWGRAIVVGDDHTYGKGTFQTFTLDSSRENQVNPQGEYKVTRGRYYTVSGRSPQMLGVEADIVIPGVLSEMKLGEKHEQYPLESDCIEPNYIDQLADLGIIQRVAVGPKYRAHLQKKEVALLPIIDALRANSVKRQTNNRAYQHFLETLKSHPDELGDDEHPVEDHQLQEALNVLRDLVLFQGGPRCMAVEI